MDQNEKKVAVARAAVDYVRPGEPIGVGTGSTANLFIDALAERRGDVPAAVASSEATAERLTSHGFEVVPLDSVDQLGLYVDGADEANSMLELIKGGGGALTREKIVASVSTRFVCIVDDSKQVDTLGAFPLPVEVVPMAQRAVANALRALGGEPRLREGFVTDNGNIILDVHGFRVDAARDLESNIDHIAGVVSNGLFARRAADVLLVAGDDGVTTFGG